MKCKTYQYRRRIIKRKCKVCGGEIKNIEYMDIDEHGAIPVEVIDSLRCFKCGIR